MQEELAPHHAIRLHESFSQDYFMQWFFHVCCLAELLQGMGLPCVLLGRIEVWFFFHVCCLTGLLSLVWFFHVCCPDRIYFLVYVNLPPPPPPLLVPQFLALVTTVL